MTHRNNGHPLTREEQSAFWPALTVFAAIWGVTLIAAIVW